MSVAVGVAFLKIVIIFINFLCYVDFVNYCSTRIFVLFNCV